MIRTKDGRFVDKRIRLPRAILETILLESKSKNNLNWHDFAIKLGVSDYTLYYDWRKKSTIPLSILKRIIKMQSKIKWRDLRQNFDILMPFWGQKQGTKSKIFKNLQPKEIMSTKFAEFYGALLGDGCIYSNRSGICISGNSILDKHYLVNYISELIYNLFKLTPKIYYSSQGKIIRCVLYNKDIVKFLVEFGFPLGYKKLGNPIIPEKFFQNKNLLKACIRAINDTDGSIYPQKNSKIILDISIHSKTLLLSMIDAFRIINFDINHTNNRIYLCGRKPVLKFLKTFGSSNLKHIEKCRFFLKNNKVPLTWEMEKHLKKGYLPKMNVPYYGPVV